MIYHKMCCLFNIACCIVCYSYEACVSAESVWESGVVREIVRECDGGAGPLTALAFQGLLHSTHNLTHTGWEIVTKLYNFL